MREGSWGAHSGRSAAIWRLARAMAVFSIAVCLATVALFFVTQAWQYLGGTALAVASFAIAWHASRLVRREVEDAAAAWITAVPLVFVPLASLLWEGIALLLALLVVCLGVVLSTLGFPPKRRAVPWIASVLAGGVIWLTRSVVLPWERVNIGSNPLAGVMLWALVGAILVIVVWELTIAYRRLIAIRSRLLATFIAAVMVVALVVSVTSILLGISTAQQRVFDQLTTAVVLKAQATYTWLDRMRFSLESLIVEDYEVQRARAVLVGNAGEESQLEAAELLRARFGAVVTRTRWFTEIFLLDADGAVVLSTNPGNEGRNLENASYFQKGLEGTYVDPPRYAPLVDGITIVLSRPLILDGVTYGVIAARTNTAQLNAIAGTGEIGRTGDTVFVNQDSIILTGSSVTVGYIPVHSTAIKNALSRLSGIQHEVYVNHRGVVVSGAYMWLPQLKTALLIEQEQSEVLSGAVLTIVVNTGVAFLAVLIAAAIATRFSDSIGRPLSDLATSAARIAGGDLDITADVARDDEIGAVARGFNVMTAQLRDLIGSLEDRVAERTRGLQAVAEVSRATTSVLDLAQLLPQVVELAQQSFDLYYVGLFLLDGARENAVLRAGTGAAGREMLANRWSLPVGGESMIGQCIVTDSAIVHQQATDQAVRFENPLLPLTRSELALPLRYGSNIIGAMTVQSVEPRAFDETSIAVFQNLADQVAVAVENARLFHQTQAALDRVRRAQRRYERRAWSEYLGTQAITGYEQRGQVMQTLDQVSSPEVRDALVSGKVVERDHELVIPILQSGQAIGAFGVQREGGFSEEDVVLVRTLVDQLALAAENQRLLDATQRREAAERLTREVTMRMREPVELEDVLRTAAEEIREALSSDWVVVRMAETPSAEYLSSEEKRAAARATATSDGGGGGDDVE